MKARLAVLTFFVTVAALAAYIAVAAALSGSAAKAAKAASQAPPAPPPAPAAPRISKVSKAAKGSTAILLTTHLSYSHFEFLSSCWPIMLNSSKLLSNADIYVYATNQEMSKSWLRALVRLPNNVSVASRSNPGYQEGAISVMHDHSFLATIDADKYEWVIRMNPDVIIYNSSRLEEMMQEPDVDAILANCGMDYGNFCGGHKSGCRDIGVHTDFTVLKTTLLHEMSKHPQFSDHAESDMMRLLSDVTQERRDRWISTHNPTTECRIQLGGEIFHSKYFHPDLCKPQEFKSRSR